MTALLAALHRFRVFGETMPPDPPPDWNALEARATEALARSHDLRALAYLAAATIRRRGLEAFFQILGVAAHWLEAFWPTVYPLLDEDAVMRRNALNSFADRLGIVDALRRTPLLTHAQLGSISLRDLELANGQIPLPDTQARRPEEAQIAAAFAATNLEQLAQTSTAIEAAIAAVRRIEVAMTAQGVRDGSPSLEPLSSFLLRIQRVLHDRMASHPQALQASAAVDTRAGGSDVVRTVTGRPVSSIQSREEALRALDAVASFFRHNEPSSPIPLFIERAKRLVAKSFLEVLADVAPDGVSQAKLVGGVRDGE